MMHLFFFLSSDLFQTQTEQLGSKFWKLWGCGRIPWPFLAAAQGTLGSGSPPGPVTAGCCGHIWRLRRLKNLNILTSSLSDLCHTSTEGWGSLQKHPQSNLTGTQRRTYHRNIWKSDDYRGIFLPNKLLAINVVPSIVAASRNGGRGAEQSAGRP